MKRKFLIAGAALLLTVMLFCMLWRQFDLSVRLSAWNALHTVLDSESLQVQLELDTGQWTAAGTAFKCQLDGEDLLGLTLEGQTIYYWDGSLYLSSGRGYDLSGHLPEELEDWEKWLPILLFSDVRQTGPEEISLQISEAQRKLLSNFLPEWEKQLGILKDITLLIRSDQGSVQELQIMGAFGKLRASVLPDPVPPMDPGLFMEMKAHREIPLEQILPLIRGCVSLAECIQVGAEAELELSCGMLPIRDRAELYRTEGKLILVRDEKAFPLKLSLPEENAGLFLGLAYLMLRDGESCPTDAGTEYRLTLPAQQVEALFEQILPEASWLGIAFEESEAAVRVSGDTIGQIRLSCGGHIPILLARIPIGFSMELTLMEQPVTLPDSVLQILSRG